MTFNNAESALDQYLFSNVFNAREPEGFKITFYGDEYLVYEEATDTFHQFSVKIKKTKKKNRLNWTNEILGQEWFEDDDGDPSTGSYKP